jgi:hypothetical protein
MSWLNEHHTAMIEYEEKKRMEKYTAENLVGHHFLCTMNREDGIYKCEVMSISPSGEFIELRIDSTLKTHSVFQWFTRYDFNHKLTILEILDGTLEGDG